MKSKLKYLLFGIFVAGVLAGCSGDAPATAAETHNSKAGEPLKEGKVSQGPAPVEAEK
jgi:hypothetical protein